jgi:hypothetical protein
MRAHLAILVLVGAVSTTSAGQLMDENTHELTNRGAIVSMVASAQVSEMRCGLKGQITKALSFADSVNIHLDLNDKNDYSDVLFFATEIIGTAKKTGWDNWCKSYRDKAAPLFESNDHRDEAP